MADYEDTKVKDLIINNMSQEKFDELKAAGELDPTQVYLTPKVNALTEPYRLGYATSSSGYYLQLTPLANSDVALDLMKADGTKAFTAWTINTDGSAKLDGHNMAGLTYAVLEHCTFRGGNLSCTVPKWTYVSNSKAYLSFQTTKMPAASSSLTGIAATYIGDTDETFTKGHTYMVESDGAETTTYTWKDVYEGGGAALPDQTDNAGKFLQTNGTEVSWGNALVNNSSNTGVAIGVDTTANSIHATAVGSYAEASAVQSTAIGFKAKADVDGLGGSVAIGQNSVAKNYSVTLGNSCSATGFRSVAIGSHAAATADAAVMINLTTTKGTNNNPNTIRIRNQNGDFEIMDANGNVPRERLKNLVEVLPTADNGYTTVKNFGNGYVEITGYASIGTVGAGTGSEVQIDLPAGYTMTDANYWVNIAPTSETTMFDFKAEAKARSTTHFMVAYKNEDSATGLTAAGVYWEVRGMLVTA